MILRIPKKIFLGITGWCKRHIVPLLILALLGVTACVLLINRIVMVVPAGNVGVVYRPLSGGVDLNVVYREGLHLKLPWTGVTLYSTRINAEHLKLSLLTADLLETQVTIAFQYEINRATVPLLHRYAGADFLQKLIVPQVTAAVREMVAKHNSQEVFTGEIKNVSQNIAVTSDENIVDQLSPPGLVNIRLVTIPSVQILDISYPDAVKEAIRQKIIASQTADAYKYNLSISTQEAERKVIEAGGIKKFRDLAFGGNTEDYLRYRSIEAAEALAKSNNSKVLLFGSGPTSLPLVLDK